MLEAIILTIITGTFIVLAAWNGSSARTNSSSVPSSSR